MSDNERDINAGKERYLSQIHVWALSFGCAVGWGAFVMPGTTFLPKAGPLGTSLGLIIGAAIMFIIGVNYHFLMNRYDGSGGTLTYTIKTLGYDHGYMSAWFLLLVYIAITWANASALGLISKYLLGRTFQFGFYYQILGYDVYFGEVLLSVVAVLLCGFVCIRGKRISALIQTFLAVGLIAAIIVCVIGVNSYAGSGVIIPKPSFSSMGGTKLKQIFSIVALSPWAFVGFESISNSSAGFKFSPKKSLFIMSAALVAGLIAYVGLAQIAIAVVPSRYDNWEAYISDIGNLSGISALPTFDSVSITMGRTGVIFLGVAAFCGMMTGLIGNMIAGSRLLFAMAEEGMMPGWFGQLNEDRTPANALKFLTAISVFIPLLGRTAIGWIVDVNTVGATIAYAYTSACAYIRAKEENDKKVEITGLLGLIISALFFIYFMLWSAEAMSTESYLILAFWSIFGFFYFRFVFASDTEKKFGKSTVVWISLLFLIFFTSLMWVKNATDDMTTEVINDMSSYYELKSGVKDPEIIKEAEEYVQSLLIRVDRTLIRNSIIQMLLDIAALAIMFSIYSIIAKREKQAEIETTEAYERSMAKTIFLSNMSHDIRTPMNAIIGYINLAEEENVTYEELKEYLQKIKGSSNHLLALINDVLEMSRIESGKLELEPVPVDLSLAFRELKDLFSTQMLEKKIDFLVDASGIKEPYVYCDKNRLNRVLLNLVSNAYKFTPEGGTVKVIGKLLGSEEDGWNKYEIRVSDSGIGMSEEFAAKVFDAFEREKSDTVENIQGTGLGMAIVKNLVEMMRGNIIVNTRLGKGTEFVVTILLEPLEDEKITEMQTQSTETKAKVIDFSTKCILLVDDILINRQIAKKLLEKNGLKVVEAENGQDAVNILTTSKAGRFDAILMDVQMPVMNGYEATAVIREMTDEEKKNIPIIAMTANAFSEDIKKAMDAGMDAHVAKPIDVKKLMDTLTEILF